MGIHLFIKRYDTPCRGSAVQCNIPRLRVDFLFLASWQLSPRFCCCYSSSSYSPLSPFSPFPISYFYISFVRGIFYELPSAEEFNDRATSETCRRQNQRRCARKKKQRIKEQDGARWNGSIAYARVGERAHPLHLVIIRGIFIITFVYFFGSPSPLSFFLLIRIHIAYPVFHLRNSSFNENNFHSFIDLLDPIYFLYTGCLGKRPISTVGFL